jgi:hypothetical protein
MVAWRARVKAVRAVETPFAGVGASGQSRHRRWWCGRKFRLGPLVHYPVIATTISAARLRLVDRDMVTIEVTAVFRCENCHSEPVMFMLVTLLAPQS